MCFFVFFAIPYVTPDTHTRTPSIPLPPHPVLKAVSRLSRGGRPLDEAISRG